VAAGLADRDGTVLLHTQRDWQGTGKSWLLLDPVWALRREGNEILAEGDVPALARASDHFGIRLEQLRSLAPDGDGEQFPLFAGFLGYEEGSRAFGCRHSRAPGFTVPDSWIGCFDAALVFGDGASPRFLQRDLSGFGGPDPAPRRQWLLERIREATARGALLPPTGHSAKLRFLDEDWHSDAILQIREALVAGDTYQVNLTGFASAETTVCPFEHFLRHSAENPVAFGAFLRTCGVSISCHSPERLLRIDGDRARTAPVKGTIERSANSKARLVASAKDRAEHLMIVDLCRNDLGRRARPGSVQVTGLMETLEVRGIDHLVSRIEARVRSGAGGGLLDSMFPGGSITGAPKRRSMEIISAVERSGRGPYTGSIGYITPDGDMDFNIAIRTAVWQDEEVHFGCGGGIVIDSECSEEFSEARLKTRSFFDSLIGCSTT
jgi:para-aminobenzoate synthetase component 1